MRTLADIPNYEATAVVYTNFDGLPVTYEMAYTEGECVCRVTGEVRGYHCWHIGFDGEGAAFCCRCSVERPPMPDEPAH